MNLANIKKSHKIILFFLAILITFLCYSNHFNNPFEFDDEHTISNNLNIRSLKNIPTFFKDATTTSSLPANQAYRPGLTTLNAIDFYLGGKEMPIPFHYHLSIFISFILLGLVFFKVCSALLKNYYSEEIIFYTSLFATLFLWLHTANTATINYIITRADSFSTLMVLLAFYVYMQWQHLRKFYLYLIPLVVGFLVKEPTIMFVPLLFVYKLLFEQQENIKALVSSQKNKLLIVLKECAIPFILIICLYAFSRYMTPKNWTSGSADTFGYLISQPYSILHYFLNYILPANLVIDTDWRIVPSITDDRVLIGVGFIIGLLILIYKTSFNHKPVAFGLAWFLLALLPTSSVFPLAEVMNDHRPFFAYIGLFIVVAYILGYWFTNKSGKFKNILKASCIALLIFHAIGTYTQNIIWQTSEGIWHEATVKAPLNPRAWMNYANTLMARADYKEAERVYAHALTISPTYSYLHINLGIVSNMLGKKNDAENYFKHAIELDSKTPECYYQYGKFLLMQNRIEEANLNTIKGLELSPKHSALIEQSTIIQKRITNPQGYKNERIAKGIEFCKANPTADNYLNLSLEYYNSGKYEDCIKTCEEALKLNPNYALAYNNICSSYNELKQWKKAEEAANKGLAIEPNNQLLKGNLNVALEELKKQK
jgi:tetratricopeptide (TPR) repeat protein